MPRRLARLLPALGLLGLLALAPGLPAAPPAAGAAPAPQAAGTAGATRWYFAEGFTATGFDEYLTILNPNPAAAAVRITYYRAGAPPVVKTLTVGATRRVTVAVHDAALGVGRNGGRGWEVAAVVEATNGVGLVVERPMYFAYRGSMGVVTGGTTALGATAPSRVWHFAEGFTGTGFDEYLTILNPFVTKADVELTYYFGGGRAPLVKGLLIAGESRATVAVHDPPLGVGRNGGQGWPVAVTVRDYNFGVVVERPMYFRYTLGGGGPAVDDGHLALGATAPRPTWLFAEGYTAPGFDEYLTILNPNPAATPVRITYALNGGAPVLKELTVAAASRATVAVHEAGLGVGRNGGIGWEVAATVEAINGAGIVAERPMYFSYVPAPDATGAGGAAAAATSPPVAVAGGGAPGQIGGGHDALGATAPSQAWHFAEGYTGAGFDEYLTILNPNASPAPVTLTYYLADGATRVKALTVPARARATVAVHDATLGVGRGQAVAARAETSHPGGVVVERPIYFRYTPSRGGGPLAGGHVAVGAPGAAFAGQPIPVGFPPSAVAVNSATNRVYVAPGPFDTVTVIDGATNAAVGAPIQVGDFPVAIAANPATNRIYVANGGDDTVTVIDGATNAVVGPPIPAGIGPTGVAVNPATNRVYVANGLGGTVTVIDGATNAAVATIPVGDSPWAVAANPATNRVYVATPGRSAYPSRPDAVTVIDGATNAAVAAIPVGAPPIAMAVNPATNRVYVVHAGSDTMTVIDGATDTVVGPPIAVGDDPRALAANPATNRVHVANAGNNTVTVIDGATGAAVGAPIPVGIGPTDVAVNPATNRVYVANGADNTVTVYQD